MVKNRNKVTRELFMLHQQPITMETGFVSKVLGVGVSPLKL